MEYINEAMLRRYATDSYKLMEAGIHIKKYALTGIKRIFLSHSHKDKMLAEGLINYLGTIGIDLYVDWNDTNMPKITNRQTAESIKSQIVLSDFFLILATSNALNSKWVPWEIGVADQIKGGRKMAIIPVADDSGQFKGNEYLQLYKCIRLEGVYGEEIKLFEAGAYAGSEIKDWLLS